MIPIKIVCGCGQKYSFEVDPSSGATVCAIQCPVCGADGSEAANQMIAEQSANRQGGLQVRRHPLVEPPPKVEPPKAPRLNSQAELRKRPKGWLVPALGVSAIVVVALLIGIIASAVHATNKTPNPAASINTAGLPRSLVELNAWYAEPGQGKNAAEHYLRAFSSMHISSVKLLPPTARMPAYTKSGLRGMVESNAEALQLLREGAKHELSRYPLDLTQGFETTLPHLGKLRDATKLLLFAATIHAEEQNCQEATADVLAALALGRSLQTEPLLLSQFIRGASISTALAALEQTLNRTHLSPENLTLLARMFEQLELSEARGDAFNRAMSGERATALSILDAPKVFLAKLTSPGGANVMKADEREKWISCLQNTGNFKAELQYYETTFQKLMEVRRQVFPARLRAGDYIGQRTTEAKTTGMVMNDLLMPGRVGTASKEAECLAHFRLGVAAIALEQFRAAHANRYPAALSDLPRQNSPDALKDPFNGEPLRYEHKGLGYVLYSIGPNLSDDSGERTKGKDIVFEVGGFAGTP
ncbi:MAG TPA: hypothetical protein VMZ27_02485 [Candidatus Saccharimonadales bacterium]|nr:hypothetical protein [Candidatus Saccharimonadales bacterium]